MLRCVLQDEVLRDRQGLKKAEEIGAGEVNEKPMAIAFSPSKYLAGMGAFLQYQRRVPPLMSPAGDPLN
jgi:hypothetical protein